MIWTGLLVARVVRLLIYARTASQNIATVDGRAAQQKRGYGEGGIAMNNRRGIQPVSRLALGIMFIALVSAIMPKPDMFVMAMCGFGAALWFVAGQLDI